MAAGRPVVLAIDGVIREVVECARAGVSVQPGDPEGLAGAIRGFVDDPLKGKQMGRNGRGYVESHFERSQLADHLLEIMKGLYEP